MPMTLEEQKAYIELLTDLMTIHFKQIHTLQLSVGKALESAAEAHGLAAVPLVEHAMKKMKAAALCALPVESVYKM
jgi:hypothetical protein